MRKFLVLLLLVSSSTYASTLPLKAKKIILEEITYQVYYEEDGFKRMPSNLSDFTFIQTDEAEFKVLGDSYSEWDDKVIHYDCQVKVLTRGMIKSTKDIEVNCKLDGENWPNG